jgi:hypothetical protein
MLFYPECFCIISAASYVYNRDHCRAISLRGLTKGRHRVPAVTWGATRGLVLSKHINRAADAFGAFVHGVRYRSSSC